jgi:hypothetical protein
VTNILPAQASCGARQLSSAMRWRSGELRSSPLLGGVALAHQVLYFQSPVTEF